MLAAPADSSVILWSTLAAIITAGVTKLIDYLISKSKDRSEGSQKFLDSTLTVATGYITSALAERSALLAKIDQLERERAERDRAEGRGGLEAHEVREVHEIAGGGDKK